MPALTYIIIGVTVAISLMAWASPKMMQKWLFNPYLIYSKNEWYRFFTSGFIHLDYMHLIFNMVSLYFLGVYSERAFLQQFGEKNYIAIFAFFYISALVIAVLPTYFRYRQNPYYNALGASGAVSAVVFSAVIIEPSIKLIIFPIPFPIPGILYAILYVTYSAYMAKNAQDNIGHEAHLFGSLYGIAFSLFAFPNSINKIIETLQEIF